MAWIERSDLRRLRAKVFQDDGDTRRFHLVACVADLHYQNGAVLSDINENFEDDTLTGFNHKVEKTRHIIHIGNTGTRRWLPRRDKADEYIGFGRLQSYNGTSWVNVNLGTPTRNGQVLSWSTTAFDLTLAASWNKVKIEVVLKTSTAVRPLRWLVSLNGLTYNDGTLTATSDSEVVGHVDKPVAWDANGTNVPITVTYSGGYLQFGGDFTGAVLPVTIDPTLTLQPDGTAGIDNYVTTENATTNYGTANQLVFNNNGSTTALVKFDLSSISGATINSASLNFWGSDTLDYGEATLTARRILSGNSGWTETGSNWNYAVSTTTRWAGDSSSDGGADAGCTVSGTDVSSTAMGSLACSSANLGAANAAISISLGTSEVSSMVSANYGIAIVVTTGSFYDYFSVHSSDGSTSGYRPQIVIDYTAGGTSTPMTLTGASTPSGAITKSFNSTKTGAVTMAGVLTRVLNLARTLAGAITPSGVVRKQSPRTFAGAVTQAGTLGKAAGKTLTGAVTQAGTLAKSVGKTLTGAVTIAGTVTKQLQRTITGAVTMAGAYTGNLVTAGITTMTFTGGVVMGGVMTTALNLVRTFTGAIAPGGTLSRVINAVRTFVGSITPTGVLSSGAAVPMFIINNVILRPFTDKRIYVEFRDKRMMITFRDKRITHE
jgi:hypothetical protein